MFQGDRSNVGTAEKWFFTVMTVSKLRERLEAFYFKLTFQCVLVCWGSVRDGVCACRERLNEVRSNIAAILSAVEEVCAANVVNAHDAAAIVGSRLGCLPGNPRNCAGVR